MFIPFSEEFEYEANDGTTYYVQTTGYRDTDDVSGITYTEIEFLDVTDDAGNDFDEYTDVYKDIADYIHYDRDFEVDEYGFGDDAYEIDDDYKVGG